MFLVTRTWAQWAYLLAVIVSALDAWAHLMTGAGEPFRIAGNIAVIGGAGWLVGDAPAHRRLIGVGVIVISVVLTGLSVLFVGIGEVGLALSGTTLGLLVLGVLGDRPKRRWG